MATVPARLKLDGSASKVLFKRILSKHLPASVFAKRKQGFAVPKGAWFRKELRETARERLLDPRTLARGYFRPEAVREVLSRHEEGRRDYATGSG